MKRFTAIILCAVLVFFSPSAAYASSSGSVVVTGGSIASGGLSGGYSGKSESAAITLTMALMYSLGLTVKLSQDAINAGQSAYSYVKGKFYEWVGGSSAGQMTDREYNELKSRFSIINGGSNIGPDGKIYFNGTAIDLIRRFLNWLKESNYIGVTSSSSVGGINNLNTFYGNIFDPLPATSTSNERYFGSSSNTGSGTQQVPVNILIYNVYENATTFRRVYVGIDTGQYIYVNQYLKSNNSWFALSGRLSTVLNGYRYIISSNIPLSEHISGETFINSPDDTNFQQTVRDFINGESSGDINVPNQDGIDYEGDFDPDTLNNHDGKQTVVNPPVIDPMEQQNPNANAQIGVENYLELLKQLLNKYTNPQAVVDPVPAQDLPTLSPIQLPVPDNLPVTWPVELPSSPTAPEDLPQDSTPVVDPDQPVDPDISIPQMSAHLEDYFPFCLPFDVYKIMQKFNGSPQAPQVHLSFDAPGLNIHIPLDLDFSVFDSVAAVLRNGEAVLYVVGLAVVTRKTFLRG